MSCRAIKSLAKDLLASSRADCRLAPIISNRAAEIRQQLPMPVTFRRRQKLNLFFLFRQNARAFYFVGFDIDAFGYIRNSRVAVGAVDFCCFFAAGKRPTQRVFAPA
jgi:hypothetical protein